MLLMNFGSLRRCGTIFYTVSLEKARYLISNYPNDQSRFVEKIIICTLIEIFKLSFWFSLNLGSVKVTNERSLVLEELDSLANHDIMNTKLIDARNGQNLIFSDMMKSDCLKTFSPDYEGIDYIHFVLLRHFAWLPWRNHLTAIELRKGKLMIMFNS